MAATTDDGWTAEENQFVDKLRTRLADLLGGAAAPVAVTDAAEDTEAAHAAALADDGTLLRFGIARKMVLDDAEAMFRATVAWRANTVGLNRLWRNWQDSGNSEAALAQRFFYGGRFGDTLTTAAQAQAVAATPAGSGPIAGPVLVERLGRVDLRGIVREAIVPLVTKSYIAYLEDAFRIVRHRGGARSTVRAVIVIDCDGAGFAHLQHLRVIKALAAVATSYFPEITRRVYLVRSGFILPLAWKAISPLLPAHTRAKVRIVGSLAEMQEDIAPEALPAEVSYEPAASRSFAEYGRCAAELVPVGTRAAAAAFE